MRIECSLVADGQPARQATARPRSVSCCWQNMGRERLGPGSGWWAGDVGRERQRGGRGGEGGEGREEKSWQNVERRVLSAPRPFHTIRVICGT